MIKSEFIEALADKQGHLEFKDAELAVNIILEQMTLELSSGGRIEIRGFGALSTRKRPAKIARNPKTGEPVPVPKRYAIHFKMGKGLAESLNKKTAFIE